LALNDEWREKKNGVGWVENNKNIFSIESPSNFHSVSMFHCADNNAVSAFIFLVLLTENDD
jgi:hypothetical protein